MYLIVIPNMANDWSLKTLKKVTVANAELLHSFNRWLLTCLTQISSVAVCVSYAIAYISGLLLKFPKRCISFIVPHISKNSAKKKFGLFLNRLCTLVLDPFLTRPNERAFSVAHSMGKWKTDAQNQISRPIEKQLGKLFFVVYRLNGTCSQLSFSMYFYQKFLQWGFCGFRQLTEYCLSVPC